MHKPKKINLNKGLSEVYRLYVLNDINSSNKNKYKLYLPNVYIRNKSNEKRSNSNSYLVHKNKKA